jgi:hypothetical protein
MRQGTLKNRKRIRTIYYILQIACNALVRTHMGRGTGNYIEKQLFSAKNYVCVCSPFISPSYAKRLLQLLDRGIKAKVITSDSENKDRNGDSTRSIKGESQAAEGLSR